MGRKPTAPDQKGVNFSVNLALDVVNFLDGQKGVLGVNSVAEVIRKAVEAYRTWFSLPPYMATRLSEEMHKKELTFFTFVQEVLAQKYEALKVEDASSPPRRSK